jgi:hypothetical protein
MERTVFIAGGVQSFLRHCYGFDSQQKGGGGAHYFGFGFPHEFVAELGIPLE